MWSKNAFLFSKTLARSGTFGRAVGWTDDTRLARETNDREDLQRLRARQEKVFMAKRSQARVTSSPAWSFEEERGSHGAPSAARFSVRSTVPTRSGQESREEPDPMQAGARAISGPCRFPKQPLSKPGSEADLNPRPLYDAPDYKGSDKLEGKVALITRGRLRDRPRPSPCSSRAKGRISRSPTSKSMRMQRKRSARWRKRGATASRFRAMSPIRSFAKHAVEQTLAAVRQARYSGE